MLRVRRSTRRCATRCAARNRSCSRRSPPGPIVGAKLLVAAATAPTLGTLGDPDLDRVVARDALGELEAGLTSTRHYGAHGEAREDTVSVFIESFAPPPRMMIFGAVDFTARARRASAKVLGYRVVVCDARAVFATRQRFPMADEVVNEWPDRYLEKVGDELGPRDAVCVLTHDTQVRRPGHRRRRSRPTSATSARWDRARTHAKRVERLREAGVADAGLDRIHAPIGLDIGARTPEETAVSICAEIIAEPAPVATRDGHCATATGPIHAGGTERTASEPDRTAARGGRGGVAAGSGSPTRHERSAAAKACSRRHLRPRRRERIDAAAAEIGPARSRWSPTSSTEAGAAAFVRAARDALGGIDILVCQRWRPAARDFASAPTRAQYRAAIELNCLAHIAMCGEAVPAMQRAAVGEGGGDHVGRGSPTDRRADPLEHCARWGSPRS